MKKSLSACTVGLICMVGWTFAGEQKKKVEDPTPRKDAILKLFVEEFVPITPGKKKFPESFMMGSEKDGHDNERPAHKVTFKYSFAMAKYEVTQELYHVVMGKNNAEFQGPRNGMDRVNWIEANEFCEKATKLLRDAKLIGANERIRLPSEAEWEYCCRAGTTTAWSFGDDEKEIGKYAWWKENSAKEDPPVGKKLPNAWGLYDMHGYVWEWCLDPWHPDYKDAPTDGTSRPKSDSKDRILRGGAYNTPAADMRCAYRHHADPETRNGQIGFRCVKETVGIAGGTTQMVSGSKVTFGLASGKVFREVNNDQPRILTVSSIPKVPNQIRFDALAPGIAHLKIRDEDKSDSCIDAVVVSGAEGERAKPAGAPAPLRPGVGNAREMAVGETRIVQMATMNDINSATSDNPKVVSLRANHGKSDSVLFEAVGPGRALVNLRDRNDVVETFDVTVVSDPKK